jgi:hypothetical protein
MRCPSIHWQRTYRYLCIYWLMTTYFHGVESPVEQELLKIQPITSIFGSFVVYKETNFYICLSFLVLKNIYFLFEVSQFPVHLISLHFRLHILKSHLDKCCCLTRASAARRHLSERKTAMKFVILHKAPKQDNNLMCFCRCYVCLKGTWHCILRLLTRKRSAEELLSWSSLFFP